MDKNFNSLCDSLVSLIEGSSRILLTTHYNPDGDGLGASQAFFHYLNDIGKDVRIIVDSTISHPIVFNFPYFRENFRYMS